MSPSSVTTASQSPVGIGLKPVHAEALLAQPGCVDFVEVHAENYMVDGGPHLRQLARVREQFALSLHGVALSIGGSAPLDRQHLASLRKLIDRFEPRWFSEHLAWSSHAGVYFNDLLPLPYTTASLQRVCDHIDSAQQALNCRLLLENPATYLAFADASLSEAAFLSEVVRRTGCGLLLDVNNAHVSAVNHGGQAWDLIGALPAAAIGEIHVAGFAEDRDSLGARLLIDSHGAPVDDAVWALLRRTLSHLASQTAAPAAQAVPVLIERDNQLPPLAELLAEVELARQARP